MVVIEDFEVPKSCLRCTKRKCLHIDGKTYQMCGLNEDGYLTESWFNSENLPKDRRSVHCPLREVDAIPKAEYENRLKADLKAIFVELQLEIEEIEIDEPFGFEPISKTSAFYEGVSASSKVIQQKIDKLKGN